MSDEIHLRLKDKERGPFYVELTVPEAIKLYWTLRRLLAKHPETPLLVEARND